MANSSPTSSSARSSFAAIVNKCILYDNLRYVLRDVPVRLLATRLLQIEADGTSERWGTPTRDWNN